LRHERFGRRFLPAVFSRAIIAPCHAELGMFAEGRALGDEGLQIAESADHPASLMVASWGLGLLSLRHGDGRIGDAVPLLTQAMEQAMAMDIVYTQGLCGLSLGEALLLAGRLEQAHALAEGALAHAHAHQERGHQAYALCLLGAIAAQCEPLEREAAEAHYVAALSLARELGMRPLMAHCHLGLGTLYRQIGRFAEAQAALSTAIELYRAMDMTFWLPQTEAALAPGG
jgi:tetratricopeptide (TPR) repeat protein